MLNILSNEFSYIELNAERRMPSAESPNKYFQGTH